MEITVAIIALLVSIISLIASFLQPEIRKWFKKKFFRYKLNFIAIDNLILFFNRAGSYLRLSVTLQPPNDAMTIKNVAVETSDFFVLLDFLFAIGKIELNPYTEVLHYVA